MEKHSHGLRQLAAIEAVRGSFDDTVAAIERGIGVRLGKPQVEEPAHRVAVDVNEFYTQRRAPAGARRDVLGLSADGKGIVMRRETLRPATANAVASSTTKLATRLYTKTSSQGPAGQDEVRLTVAPPLASAVGPPRWPPPDPAGRPAGSAPPSRPACPPHWMPAPPPTGGRKTCAGRWPASRG